MKKHSGNRILMWALGVSLALHGVFAFVLHATPPVEAKEQPPTHFDVVRRVEPPPTPTPPPAPPKRRVRPQLVARPNAVAVHVPHATPIGPGDPRIAPVAAPTGGPGDGGDGNLPATGTPAPTDPPKPACSAPDVPARTVSVVSPEVPEDAMGIPDTTAQIEVTLRADGSVEAAKVLKSAGLFTLDRSAVAAAKATTYAPEIRACVPVGGSYLFTVNFST